jgi:hypothetical protein
VLRYSVTAFAKIIFLFGMGLMLVAPLLRRRRLASPALGWGASLILAVSAFGLAHLDPRYGHAANESDRRFYLLFLAVELPVLALALALYLAIILIWLEFFWHW